MLIVNLIVLCLILFIYSFLFKDNFLFKLTERFVVGISAAYGFIKLLERGFYQKMYIPLTNHDYSVILPALVGLLFLGSFHKKTAFLTKYSLAFLLGVGAGLEIGPRLETDIVKQIISTQIHFNNVGVAINDIIIVIALLTAMFYFLFVFRKETPLDSSISKIGIFFIMVSFGASFGYTIMARISLLIEVIKYVLHMFS